MSPRSRPDFDASDGGVAIRDCAVTDYDSVLRLNEDAIPAVNRISRQDLAHLHEQSLSFRVAMVGCVGVVWIDCETIMPTPAEIATIAAAAA
jgi:hypothetical protein